MPKLVLSLMVKNESHVIRRMLSSVIPFIDCWCVVDTGSTDGTQGIVREMLGHLPGALHQAEWVNFGHNRSQAVALARPWADYSLIVDADLVLTVNIPVSDPRMYGDVEERAAKLKALLTADAYEIRYSNGLDYTNTRIISNRHEWKYIGVTHEYITSPTAQRAEELREVQLIDFADGGNRKDKFERDIKLLTEDLRGDPHNARSVFYLAQSYENSGKWGQALFYYEKRTKMGGFDEEVWYSRHKTGILMKIMNVRWDQVEAAFLQAYGERPHRLEPISQIVAHYVDTGQYAKAMLYASIWWLGPQYPTTDRLFIDRDTYTTWLPYNFMQAALKTGRLQEAKSVAIRLLQTPGLSPVVREAADKVAGT